jgi:hypothetical protein
MAIMVYRVRMPDGVPERTDGVNIYVDDRLDPIGERCAIEHALVHIEWGHSTLQREDVEMAVRYETAKRLLPLGAIIGACKDGLTLKQIARSLGVTRQVLMDRAATLTDEQARMAGCAMCLKCPVIAARFAGHPSGLRRQRVAA